MHIPVQTAQRATRTQLPATEFELINPPTDFEQPEDVEEYFSLTAPPNSRLGRRSPLEDEVTAPMLVQRLRHPFVLCEVTISADFQNDWDQGGIAIFAGGHPTQNTSFMRPNRRSHVMVDPRLSRAPSKWARVGIELTNGELVVSTLVANPKCGVDWASTPAFPSVHPSEAGDMLTQRLRLKLERVGQDLWVWFMHPESHDSWSNTPSPEAVSRRWRKCREIVNFFDVEAVKGDVWVGCYASRPIEPMDTCSEEGLFVEFEDLEIL